MIGFITQNLATIVVASLLAGMLFVAGRRIVLDRRAGKGCGCGCDGCATSAQCGERRAGN